MEGEPSKIPARAWKVWINWDPESALDGSHNLRLSVRTEDMGDILARCQALDDKILLALELGCIRV